MTSSSLLLPATGAGTSGASTTALTSNSTTIAPAALVPNSSSTTTTSTLAQNSVPFPAAGDHQTGHHQTGHNGHQQIHPLYQSSSDHPPPAATNNGDPTTAALLTFADIPSDLAHLNFHHRQEELSQTQQQQQQLLPQQQQHQLHQSSSSTLRPNTAKSTKSTKSTRSIRSVRSVRSIRSFKSTDSSTKSSFLTSLTPSRSSSRASSFSSRHLPFSSSPSVSASDNNRDDNDNNYGSPTDFIPEASPPSYSASPVSVSTYSPNSTYSSDVFVSPAPSTPAPHSSSAHSSPHGHPLPRKPSPGLALRLRALGFGPNAHKASPPAATEHNNNNNNHYHSHHHDHVGRLPQDQLRQIDQKHQSASAAPVIERRGRPWKGAGAVVARLPSSLVGLAAGGRSKTVEDLHSRFHADAAAAVDSSIPAVVVQDETLLFPQSSSLLPEIETAPPLTMDTNKYILPDQVNGNGTKVQLEMRQKHLERGSVLTTTFAAETIEIPPPPLPKDSPPQTPPSSNNNNNNNMTQQGEYTPGAVSYFNPLGLQRPGSIYTLSRVSFTNQLAQLTSLQLPDAESLSSKVTNIPTAQAASRALIGAADQIRKWISKASEVIDGLDSDDDVEWAAAGGREGLEEVENAILRFEELINVYVGAIEELQGRSDIADVAPEDLQCAVVQMESILDEWRKMRTALQNVKAQVEIAMEWEELWSMVLGDIQNEMDELARLVFEMEERRHKSIMAGSVGDGSGVDIGDLETIVEETQNQQNQQPQSVPTRLHAASGNNRYSIPVFPASPTSPDLGGSGSNSTSTTATTTGTATTATTGTTGTTTTATTNTSEDDSSLLALFARMQPLRASLDFLPMRLSVFETRASSCFPTACDELEMHRENLDASYKKLEKDAESLRKELGEDRWVTVFRGAARQAQKMYESVERSVAKLKEAIDAGLHLTNPALMGKKMENYESKKTHYGPAIERVLAIIDRGVQDRLTLNGEILRLHAELQAEWSQLKEAMHEVDVAVEELHADESRNQQLRDSISSMLSNDRSTIGSGHDTPQSSPPSSVILSTLGLDNNDRSNSRNAKHGNKNNANNNAQKRPGADKPPFRPPGYTNSTYTPTSIKRRPGASSHLPQPTKTTTTTTPSRKPMPRFSTSVSAGVGSMGSGAAAAKSSPIRDGSVTPMGRRSSMLPSRPSSSLDKRPRWNSSTNGVDTGHNFKPLTLTTPSPYAKTKTPVTRRTAATTPGSGPGSGPGSSGSGLSTRLPMRSPLSRATSMSPGPDGPSQGGTDGPDGTPTRGRPLAVRDMPLRPRLASQASMAALDNRRASMQQPPRMANQDGLGLGMAPRPASSMAMSRRASMLPTTTTMHGRKDSSVSGRESPQAVAGARMAMRKKAAEQALKERPRWRV